VPDLPVAGPLGELHLRHEARLDPVGPFRERAGRRRVERRGVDRDGLEQSAELPAERVIPAFADADLPGESERAALVVPDEDGPDAFARAFGLGEPADDELLGAERTCSCASRRSATRAGTAPCGTC
jgi:hypothetical protein